MTGIPVVNVNNNCSTGSSALFLARQAVATGAADCVLAFGFEQMQRGALRRTGRPAQPARALRRACSPDSADPAVPMAPQYFGGAGAAYCERYGMDPATFAQISVKARKHAANNPYAVFRDPITVEEVLASPQIYGPLTRLQCCPPTCGAAAAVLVSAEFARRHGLRADVADRGAGDDHRHPVDLRRRHDQAGRLRHGAGRRAAGLRSGRRRPGGHPGRRAARLLHHQRAAHLRGARADPGGHGGEVHPRRRQHLRRPGRHQPVRRPAVQGPPARRHRPGAVRRADLAAARRGRRPPGRGRRPSPCSTTSASAAPPSSRSTRRWAEAWRSIPPARRLWSRAAHRRRSSAAGWRSSRRPPARPTRSTPTWTRRRPPATATCRCRRRSCSPRAGAARPVRLALARSASTCAACCTASRPSPTTPSCTPATP